MKAYRNCYAKSVRGKNKRSSTDVLTYVLYRVALYLVTCDAFQRTVHY